MPSSSDDEKAHRRAPRGRGRIGTSRDPILTRFRDLAHAAGRREHAQFLAEGLTLVQRAVNDGLPVEAILYTPELQRISEGAQLLRDAREARIQHYLVSEGLLGKITTTRPVPEVIAAVFGALLDVEQFKPSPTTSLLIAENINNPDNLGMLLRTADAAGTGGMVVIGEKTDPFHKNCVRAARGAVGRVPLLSCRDPQASLRHLKEHGFRILGATSRAETVYYCSEMKPPIAVVVGNEQAGISPELLEVCTAQVRIPMAPGQDSLNVGVAAGVLLYEIVRQQRVDALSPLPFGVHPHR